MRAAMVNPRKRTRRSRLPAEENRARKRRSYHPKRKAGRKRRCTTAYQRFVGQKVKSMTARGTKPQAAFKKAVKMWKSGDRRVSRKPRIRRAGRRKAHGRRRYRSVKSVVPKGALAPRVAVLQFEANKRRRRRKNPSNMGTTAGGRKGWARRKAKTPTYRTPAGARYAIWQQENRRRRRRYAANPNFGAIVPSFGEMAAMPIPTVGGFLGGALGAAAVGAIPRVVFKNDPVLSEVGGIAGNIAGTELTAYIAGYLVADKPVVKKTARIGGYTVTAVSAVLGMIRLFAKMKKGAAAPAAKKAKARKGKKGKGKLGEVTEFISVGLGVTDPELIGATEFVSQDDDEFEDDELLAQIYLEGAEAGYSADEIDQMLAQTEEAEAEDFDQDDWSEDEGGMEDDQPEDYNSFGTTEFVR